MCNLSSPPCLGAAAPGTVATGNFAGGWKSFRVLAGISVQLSTKLNKTLAVCSALGAFVWDTLVEYDLSIFNDACIEGKKAESCMTPMIRSRGA